MATENNQPDYKTSLTHPLRIDTVSAGCAGGLIGITFCPGKYGDSFTGAHWRRDLSVDLDVIQKWGANAVVTLIEEHEFVLLEVEELGVQIKARGMELHHLPITDVQPPDQRFEDGWSSVSKQLTDLLRSGGRILVHCRGGLGRAGTVAALLLVELGVPRSDAVNQVREARPGAIETRAQENYVLNSPSGAHHKK